jgi:cysteine synthase
LAQIPTHVGFTYGVLHTVQKFGAAGCTAAQYASVAYTRSIAANRRNYRNSVGSQTLMSMEKRGLLMAIGEGFDEAEGAEWLKRRAQQVRRYVVSEAGKRFLAEQFAKAEERAARLAKAHSSAQDAPQAGDEGLVGSWES